MYTQLQNNFAQNVMTKVTYSCQDYTHMQGTSVLYIAATFLFEINTQTNKR